MSPWPPACPVAHSHSQLPLLALELQAAVQGQGVSEEQRVKLIKLYQELARTYPHSSACKRIALDFLQVCFSVLLGKDEMNC